MRPLDIDLSTAFARIAELPNCVWLDSVSDHQYDRGRYSFLTADPVAWCDASMASPDPWPVLGDWCRNLERCQSLGASDPEPDPELEPDDEDELPPFRGGIVGLIAYEAAWWLEPSLRPEPDADLARDFEQIPAMAIGLYDWTLATDHLRGTTWLLSTGLNELFEIDEQRAQRRADAVLEWLGGSASSPASAVRANSIDANSTDAKRPPNLQSNFTDDSFTAGVAEIIRRISAGDSFQVNLAQTLSHVATCGPVDFYQRLRQINPAPYGCFFNAGDYQVMSSSPEGFLQVRGDDVVTRPIKGTVRRTGNDDEDERLGEVLLQSEKDRAENIMIVDLMRNDLSRVCTDESVLVDGLCELEKYQRVQHLVSTVRGTLRDDVGVAELLAACFPGGSITGAPKVEAMRTIADLERQPRGPYCGSIGYIGLGSTADFNILIRTVTQRRVSHSGTSTSNNSNDNNKDKSSDKSSEWVWEFPVGGGITARSEPVRETEETWVKAASLLEAISASG